MEWWRGDQDQEKARSVEKRTVRTRTPTRTHAHSTVHMRACFSHRHARAHLTSSRVALSRARCRGGA
eukprot:7178718-Pyramimonas_sp.AAC.1